MFSSGSTTGTRENRLSAKPFIESQRMNVILCFQHLLAFSRAAKRQATFDDSQTMRHKQSEFKNRETKTSAPLLIQKRRSGPCRPGSGRYAPELFSGFALPNFPSQAESNELGLHLE